MNKIGCFVLTVVFVLSLFGALLCAANDIQAIGWKKTTLTITFIGLPDGTVFGDYTDAAGRKHENEAALTMSGFLRAKDVVYCKRTFENENHAGKRGRKYENHLCSAR